VVSVNGRGSTRVVQGVATLTGQARLRTDAEAKGGTRQQQPVKAGGKQQRNGRQSRSGVRLEFAGRACVRVRVCVCVRGVWWWW
jgi:hypothetical protein